MSEIARQADRSSPSTQGQAPFESCHAYDAVMATPWSGVKLGIRADDGAITSIDFLPGDATETAATSQLAAEAVRQLQNYFRDPRRGFNLPLAPRGTLFQQRVWDALRRIPSGATSSYGALARRLDSGARAVGGACRANPIPVIIPCHRVVAAQGLGGFMGVTVGHGMRVKQFLLDHEAST